MFFDAVPTGSPTLELDVMNPHFPDYYQSKEPPTNWQSPIPVYFLTVAPGTEFAFAVGWRGAQVDGKLRNKAVQWLKRGLTELGAGAKTNAGYGYFASEAPSAPSTPALQTQAASALSSPAEPPQGELRRSEGETHLGVASPRTAYLCSGREPQTASPPGTARQTGLQQPSGQQATGRLRIRRGGRETTSGEGSSEVIGDAAYDPRTTHWRTAAAKLAATLALETRYNDPGVYASN
ncbi:MAG: type III-B CRISPR module RAMP protein Cmr6 [Roseiflexus sp.]|nr:type III-B CRISPR module RAMP protein Cmr6 [Roseiflexus sp.]